MAKTKAGTCEKCGKPVYKLTGRDVPKHLQGFTGTYSNYVIMDYPTNKRFQHYECNYES